MTNEEAGEIFGDAVQRQLEEDEAKVEEGHCGAHGEEPPPREPADIVMALEKAMRALGDALDYMRGEHEDALGDVAGDMADQAAMINVGPMEEGSHEEGFDEDLDDDTKQTLMDILPISRQKNAEEITGFDRNTSRIRYVDNKGKIRIFDMGAAKANQALIDRRKEDEELGLSVPSRGIGKAPARRPMQRGKGAVGQYKGADTGPSGPAPRFVREGN